MCTIYWFAYQVVLFYVLKCVTSVTFKYSSFFKIFSVAFTYRRSTEQNEIHRQQIETKEAENDRKLKQVEETLKVQIRELERELQQQRSESVHPQPTDGSRSRVEQELRRQVQDLQEQITSLHEMSHAQVPQFMNCS